MIKTDKNGKEYLLLLGGTDVNPTLYGEAPHWATATPDINRDSKEAILFERARLKGIPIIGICRGAQFICVMNGGKLHQHTPDHGISHDVHTNEGVFKSVAAGHHQIMNPTGDYQVLGWDARHCMVYNSKDEESAIKDSPEVVYFPDNKCLAIQPHPEWQTSDNPFNVWLHDKMKELFNLDVNF